MAETRNIVILGTQFSGTATAHYILKHAIPKLQQVKGAKYVLHLVNPSTHFWWHVAAPREIVSVKEMKHSDCFRPTMDGFKQYTNLKDSIIFHHGSAVGIDAAARTVSIKTHEGAPETLEYYALVIATGIRSPTPLTTLHGDHTISERALEEMNRKLASAKEVVISGGGPIGVETAGEIASHLKGQAKVTLIAGSDKLLPVLRKSLAQKAQKMLEKLGVTVLYNTKVSSSEETSDGKTLIKLDNGKEMSADAYIPAFGVKPNTEFLPDSWKGKGDYVAANGQTLRVDAAGPRVYAAGDVAAADKGGIMNLYDSVPVLGANITHDLLADAGVGSAPAEKKYTRKDGETQIVPVGAKTGVGAVNGWAMPGFAISMIKGKDYFLKTMPDIYEGKKFVKA